MQPLSVFELYTTQVIFPKVRLFPRQIAAFRGAFVEWTGMSDDLFHNHIDADKVIHRYPLVQYRSSEAQASIFALQEGATALRTALINAPDQSVTCAGKPINLQHFTLLKERQELKLTEGWQTYYLNDWLALNQDNYQHWQTLHRLSEKVDMLEKLLANHLMAFLKAIGWRLPNHSLRVELMDWYDTKQTHLHGTAHIAFRVRYRCNLILPDNLAFGKGISHGFGVQNKMQSNLNKSTPKTISHKAILQYEGT